MRTVNMSRIVQGGKSFRSAFRTKRWVRVTTVGVALMVAFSAGVDTGHKEMDPRQTGGPGSTVTEEQLYGKWDGVLTDSDGNAFCLVGWPCADAGLDK